MLGGRGQDQCGRRGQQGSTKQVFVDVINGWSLMNKQTNKNKDEMHFESCPVTLLCCVQNSTTVRNLRIIVESWEILFPEAEKCIRNFNSILFIVSVIGFSPNAVLHSLATGS
jgi:hypothetical protein